jgi:hypothetical protein
MNARELRERIPSLERAVRSLKRNEVARFMEAVRESATVDHRWPPDERFWFNGTEHLKLSREENHVVRELWTRLNAALVYVVTGDEVDALDRTGIEGQAATVLQRALGGDVWLGTIGIWNALCADLLGDRLEPSLRDDLATSWLKVRPALPLSDVAS